VKKIFRLDVRIPAWLPGVLTLLLLLPGITRPFWDRDEAEYAAIARDMDQAGHFFKPELFGRPYAEKPPLAIALTAISFRWLGESELAGRLPHVLLFSGSAVVLFLIGRRLFDPRRAFFAAMMLPTSLLGILCGRLILTDSALLFFSLVAVFFLLDVLGETRDVQSAGLAGAALGLGILTKGPVAALVPGLFAIGHSLGRRRLDRGARKGLLLASAVALAISTPWFLFQSLETHGESLRSFWLRENLERFLQPLERHGGPIVYYVPVLLLGFFPWSGLLAGIVKRRSLARDPVGWGLWAWGGGVLLFFSLSATKLPSYLLPALPAFALLIARALDFPDPAVSRASRWSTASVGAVLFLAAVIVVSRLETPSSVLKVLFPLAAATLPFLALPLLPTRTGSSVGMLLLALTGAAVLSLSLPPILDGARCWARLGRRARIERLAPEEVGTLQMPEPALRYYVGPRGTETWNSREEMIRLAVASPDRSLLACLTATDALAVARDRRVHLRILGRGFNLIEDGPRESIALCRLSPQRADRERVARSRADLPGPPSFQRLPDLVGSSVARSLFRSSACSSSFARISSISRREVMSRSPKNLTISP
jgi:4-amino-4-deoxy-L-arabinose transferase-like glycosyltransferase